MLTSDPHSRRLIKLDKRINWIDTLKGIGIIFVVLGHAPISGKFCNYIFTFHMPLFFFISGYLFSMTRYPKILNFIKSRIKSLLVPYCCFSALAILILIYRSHFEINNVSVDFLLVFKSFLLAKRNFIFYNNPLWFLPSLFVVEISYYLIKKYVKSNVLIMLLLFVFGYIGVIKLQTLNSVNPLPWGFDNGMFYILFYGLANILREIKDKIKYKNIFKFVLFLYSISSTLLFYFKQNLYGKIFNAQLLNVSGYFAYLYFLHLALIGIFTYLAISKLLFKSKILNYIGNNTLTYFALHICLGFYILDNLLLIAKITPQGNTVYGILYTILALNILIPISYIINNYLPFILGKSFKSHYNKTTARI